MVIIAIAKTTKLISPLISAPMYFEVTITKTKFIMAIKNLEEKVVKMFLNMPLNYCLVN